MEMPPKRVLCALKSVDDDGHTEKSHVVMCRIELRALKPHNFSIAVFDSIRRIWKTTVSIDLLEKIATENNETGNIVSIFENTLKISNADIAAPFIFEIIDEKLLWKKKLKDAKYLYASFDLALVEGFVERDEIIREYLLFSALNAKQLNERLESTDKRILDVIEERDKTMKLLEEAVGAKEQCEEILMSKFVKILNAKKRKIAELLADQTVSDQPDCTIEDADTEARCSTFEEFTPTTSDKIDGQTSRPTAAPDSVERNVDSLIETRTTNSKLFVAPRTRSSRKR